MDLECVWWLFGKNIVNRTEIKKVYSRHQSHLGFSKQIQSGWKRQNYTLLQLVRCRNHVGVFPLLCHASSNFYCLPFGPMFKLGKPLASTRKVKIVSSALCNCAWTNKPTKEEKKRRKKFPTNLFSNHKSGYIFGAIMREKKKKKKNSFVCASKDKENSF